MRLLDLRGGDGGTGTAPTAMLREPIDRPVLKPLPLKKPLTGKASPAAARVFPINARQATPTRRPIDLVQLQQRIEELEKRIQQKLARQAESARPEEVEQLRLRIRQLERKVETELWSARQREHTLLELLARPSPGTLMRQRACTILNATPSTLWRWCKSLGKAWWLDIQPMWWPSFASAWQQAWDQARN